MRGSCNIYVILWLNSLLLFVIEVKAQCPVANFSLSDASVCRQQQFSIIDNSSNAIEYYWDFCGQDLEQTPVEDLRLNLMFSQPFGISTVEVDGNWYGFVVNRGSGNLVRIDFGPDLLNASPSVVDLENPDGLLSQPEDLEIIQVNGNWYALITKNLNSPDNTVILVDFGPNIQNITPSASDLGNFGITSKIRGLDVALDDNEIILLLAPSDRTLRLINFRDSFTNPILAGHIINTGNIGTNTIFKFDVINECDQWYGIAPTTGNINIFDFGANLFSSPSFNAYPFADISNTAFDSDIITEGDSTYVFVSNISAPYVLINVGRLSLGDTPILVPNGSGNSTLTRTDVVPYNGSFVLNGVDFSTMEYVRTIYSNNCGASIEYSTEQNPLPVNYDIDGTHDINLTVHTGDSSDHFSNSINVSNDIAPSISFTIDPSRCSSNANTFSPSTPGLDSYDWDFDGDGMIDVSDPTDADQMFNYTPGTYTARLEVSDGTCTNFTEQTITIYNPPPTPDFDYLPTTVCTNTTIDFTNLTNETGFETAPLTYSWDFNGEGMSTDKDPSFAFTTSGPKTVTLRSLIPGCEDSYFEVINVLPGPTANFSATSVCQDEAMQFTNLSTDAVSYLWDFGDGFGSTQENPSHLYLSSGNFNVSLTATDLNGCQHVFQQEVAVSAVPNVMFTSDVPCTSTGGIQFNDETTVAGASIVSRTWFIDDVEVSTLQNPLLTFENEGMVNIRLDAVSSNGCQNSYNENIEILETPQANFSINLNCLGEVSSFQDESVQGGNPITTWAWSIINTLTLDETNYNTQDITHTFSVAGNYEVILEVTAQNLCSESITQVVEVLELPAVNFEINGDCSNELIQLLDATSPGSDPIVSRSWSLNGDPVGNGAQLFLESLPGDTYDLLLEVSTQSGCIASSTEQIVINTSPTSAFTSSKTYGLPGEQILFTNQATGESSSQWLLNGSVISNDQSEETITFDEPGTHEVSLVANNLLGCSDTTTVEVLIAVPIVDLSVGRFELVENGTTGTVFLEIINNSNLPIDVTEAVIELENQFTVTEQILASIGIGETELVGLNVGIPLTGTDLSYLCVTLNSQYKDYSDITPVDNEKCVTVQPKVIVEDLFPNPARDEVRVKLVVPEAGISTMALLNSSGKVETVVNQNVEPGLNNIFFDLQTLDPGIYFVRITFGGTTSIKRIVKL